ncbi:MAG: OmpA family protein [Hyphomonas sp.]|uniref:flagellar motor protein MotB n=1 Tax=Hyphomonas sp. TaxID=87 RepID=UPI00180E1F20|nr:flagellar motor protein MotB [Hyphomonas sp.]MBA3067872.1 OmpA family protein [Hyphomonas sp.]MBU3922461.1 OmpA family protein [Alphaproteobacteria bacterium]MBU4062428.1 OmpA family protein [Alphaproteobacteria bacterium]MBU4165963.1 OmpA family protein [Alphaproteobacteria bacterium]
MNTEPSAALQPIIIRRKKVYKADGHHGGAWKVAYADFVTAMMAFFLLMWLLNATTEDQRKGLADYFNPSIPISRISGGGSDGLNGDSVFTEETLARSGTGASHKRNIESPASNASMAEAKSEQEAGAGPAEGETQAIAENFKSLKEALDEQSQQLSEHLMVKMSPEGIVLELVDSESTPLFPVGRSEPSDLLIELLDVVAESFGTFENDIKIVGHTDNRRYRNDAIYDNWNLSADRANAARRLLLRSGVDQSRIQEVTGKADTDPLIKDNPAAAQNRRISITILTN